MGSNLSQDLASQYRVNPPVVTSALREPSTLRQLNHGCPNYERWVYGSCSYYNQWRGRTYYYMCTYCSRGTCYSNRQKVNSVGYCNNCNDFEVAYGGVYDTSCERATCGTYQILDATKKDGSCVDCPTDERQDPNDDLACTSCELYSSVDSYDNSICSRPTCSWIERNDVNGVCTACEDFYKQDPNDDTQCIHQTCPEREKVLADRSCEACPDYEITNSRTDRTCVRATCSEDNFRLNITGRDGTCTQCSDYNHRDLADDTACIRGSCAWRQKVELDGSCTTCQTYYTVDNSTGGDDTLCIRPTCSEFEYVHTSGYCYNCNSYYEQDSTDDTKCSHTQCPERQKVLPDRTCEQCPDYYITSARTSRSCTRGSCDATYGGVLSQKTSRHRLNTDGTTCTPCPDYYHADPSDNSQCIHRVCSSNYIITAEASCQACPSNFIPDSYSQKICVPASISAPLSLTLYYPLNTTVTDTFPATQDSTQQFLIPAFKTDLVDDVHPVSYSLISSEPSSYNLNVQSIQRHNYLDDKLIVTYTTQEQELDVYFSKKFTLVVQATDHEATKEDTISLVLCPRESHVKIDALKGTPWVVNNVTYQYDFSQDNSLVQDPNPECQLSTFEVLCQNGGTASGTCYDYGYNQGGMSSGSVIKKTSGQTLEQCKQSCDENSSCDSFMYGVNYGGSGSIVAQDCQTHGSGSVSANNGYAINADTYVKESAVSTPYQCANCRYSSKDPIELELNQAYCTSDGQPICQTVKVTALAIDVIHTFYVKVVLHSSIEQILGPLQLNVSYCIPSSVKYQTDQHVTQPIKIQKDIKDGKILIPFNPFSFTLKDFFCHDDPKVQFNKYQLNVSNADSFLYPDDSNPDCVACIGSQSCNFTDCLSSIAYQTFQNKLIQVKIHVVIGPTSEQFHLVGYQHAKYYQSGEIYTEEYYNQYAPTGVDIQAVVDIMPTGCSEINLQGNAYRFVLMSYLSQNVNLLHMIGVEAECINSMVISTNQPERVKLGHAITYCANIRGICQVPLDLTSSDVIFYMGLTQDNGDLDITQGYVSSDSSTQLRQACLENEGLFQGKLEKMYLGMPKFHDDSVQGRTQWYVDNYESLRCFYQLKDRTDQHGNMLFTAVDVNASIAVNSTIKATMVHINGSKIDLGKINIALNTQQDPYGVGCGHLFPIALRDEKKPASDHFVFHSRDGNATLGLEQYNELINTCLYCPIKYKLKVLNDDTNTYDDYKGNLISLNSTYGLEIYNFEAQNTTSQQIYIEAFYDTGKTPLHAIKCKGYIKYSLLDVTMCNSTLLEVKNNLAQRGQNIYDIRFQYDAPEQVINFKELFDVVSWDPNSSELECTNITYTLTRDDWKTYRALKGDNQGGYAVAEENWDRIFEIDNLEKRLLIDIRLFQDMEDGQIDRIPFTIHGFQNGTQLIEQESNLNVIGPKINKSPFFADENGTKAIIGLFSIEVDLDSMRAGTAPVISFEEKLPPLLDKEGDIPIVDMKDGSGVLELREDNQNQYSITADLTRIGKKNQGQFPVTFMVTDEFFLISRQETKQYASVDIIVNGEEEVEEVEIEEVIIEEVVEEVIEEVVVEVKKLPPTSKPDASNMEAAATMRADSLIGASLVVQPKPPPGVELITEEEQNELVSDWLNNLQVEEVVYEPPPVKMKISKIKRDGNVNLGFNQDMIVPEFIKNIKSQSLRRLGQGGPTSLDEVNLGSIVSISFGIKSSIEQKDLEYYILLKDWTERGLDFQIFFDNPTLISKGNLRDTMLLDILQPQMFVSKAKGEMPSPDQLSIASNMPTQVPQGINADELEKTAEQQQQMVVGVVIMQILAATSMKGAKEDLIYLIMALQVIVALRIYDISLPPNFDEFSIKIQEIVDGEVISPQYLIQLVKPDFSYNSALGLPKGYLDGSILETWGMIITVSACIIVFLLLQGLAYLLLKSRREIIKKRLLDYKKKFIWSGLIEAHTIEYILMLTTIANNLKSIILGQQTRRRQKMIEVGVIAPELFIFPLLLLYIVKKNRKKIDTHDEEIAQKYKYLITNINIQRNWYSKYFVPIMLLRRLLLVSFPILFFQKFVFQIQSQILFSLLYIIYYSGVRPTLITQHQYLIELNEVFIMATNYHLLLFTDFVPTQKHFSVSISLVNIVLFLMMVNFCVMTYNMVCRIHKRVLAYKLRKLWESYVKEQAEKRLQRHEKRRIRKMENKMKPKQKELTEQHKIQMALRRQIQVQAGIIREFNSISKSREEEKERPSLEQIQQEKQERKEKIKVIRKSLRMRQKRWKALKGPGQLDTINEIDHDESQQSIPSIRSEKTTIVEEIRVKAKKIIQTQLVENQGPKDPININSDAPEPRNIVTRPKPKKLSKEHLAQMERRKQIQMQAGAIVASVNTSDEENTGDIESQQVLVKAKPVTFINQAKTEDLGADDKLEDSDGY